MTPTPHHDESTIVSLLSKAAPASRKQNTTRLAHQRSSRRQDGHSRAVRPPYWAEKAYSELRQDNSSRRIKAREVKCETTLEMVDAKKCGLCYEWFEAEQSLFTNRRSVLVKRSPRRR